MNQIKKACALAIMALAFSMQVGAVVNISLRDSLDNYTQAVKDSSGLSIYSATEFTGIDPQQDCFTPDDYSQYPEVINGAEICYENLFDFENGTKYISYEDGIGYRVFYKDNLINQVIIPVGSEGSGFNEANLKLRVSGAGSTANSHLLVCEDISSNPQRCNGAFITIAAKDVNVDLDAAANQLENAISQMALNTLEPSVTAAINAGENAELAAISAQLTADSAIVDAASASKKAADVEKRLTAKITSNSTAVSGASATAEQALGQSSANKQSIAGLSSSVTANTTAIGTKVDAQYVDSAIANQPVPEPDLSAVLARLDTLEDENKALHSIIYSESNCTKYEYSIIENGTKICKLIHLTNARVSLKDNTIEGNINNIKEISMDSNGISYVYFNNPIEKDAVIHVTAEIDDLSAVVASYQNRGSHIEVYVRDYYYGTVKKGNPFSLTIDR